jgi:hypothetical protein
VIRAPCPVLLACQCYTHPVWYSLVGSVVHQVKANIVVVSPRRDLNPGDIARGSGLCNESLYAESNLQHSSLFSKRSNRASYAALFALAGAMEPVYAAIAGGSNPAACDALAIPGSPSGRRRTTSIEYMPGAIAAPSKLQLGVPVDPTTNTTLYVLSANNCRRFFSLAPDPKGPPRPHAGHGASPAGAQFLLLRQMWLAVVLGTKASWAKFAHY